MSGVRFARVAELLDLVDEPASHSHSVKLGREDVLAYRHPNRRKGSLSSEYPS